MARRKRHPENTIPRSARSPPEARDGPPVADSAARSPDPLVYLRVNISHSRHQNASSSPASDADQARADSPCKGVLRSAVSPRLGTPTFGRTNEIGSQFRGHHGG